KHRVLEEDHFAARGLIDERAKEVSPQEYRQPARLRKQRRRKVVEVMDRPDLVGGELPAEGLLERFPSGRIHLLASFWAIVSSLLAARSGCLADVDRHLGRNAPDAEASADVAGVSLSGDDRQTRGRVEALGRRFLGVRADLADPA